MLERIANTGLRFAAVGSRFLLLICLARLLTPAEVGQYGLFLASTLFAITLVGAELHTFGLRELLRRGHDQWSFVVQHSAIAWVVAYLLLAPLLLASTSLWELQGVSWYWFPALLLTEHLCQESNRLLVTIGRPLAAGAAMFVRMGAWVWVAIPLLWYYPNFRSLNVVMLCWFIGSSLALLLSVRIAKLELGAWQWSPLDAAWIGRGIRVGMLYLSANLVYRGLFAIDRFLVGHLNGSDFLGVYVFYIGLAMAVVTVLEPSILAFQYPPIVSAWQNGRRDDYARLYSQLRRSMFFLSTATALAISLLSPFLFDWLARPVYASHMPMLWVLLLMAWISANVMTLDVGLYAQGQDRVQTTSMCAAFVMFCFGVASLGSHFKEYAVPLSLVGAFMIAYVVKASALRSAGSGIA